MIEETCYPKRYRKRSLSSKMQPRYKNTQYSTSLFPVYIRTSLLPVLVAREISISFPVGRKSKKEREKSRYRRTAKSVQVDRTYPIFPFFARQIQIQIKISLSFSKRRSERQSSRLKCRLGQRSSRGSNGCREGKKKNEIFGK